jgi:hypothetical protein
VILRRPSRFGNFYRAQCEKAPMIVSHLEKFMPFTSISKIIRSLGEELQDTRCSSYFGANRPPMDSKVLRQKQL